MEDKMSKNIFTKQGIQEIAELIQETKNKIIEKGKKVVQARLGNEQAEISEAILEEIAVNYDLDKLERLLS